MERWGTYAVDDHTDAAFLAHEVLLYDKLVLPVPSSEYERDRWRKNKWDPDLLDRRLEQLAGLVYRRSWSESLRQLYQDTLRLRDDIEHLERGAFGITRMVLRQDEEVRLAAAREGSVRVVAAYRGPDEFVDEAASQREAHDRAAAQLTLLVGHELLAIDAAKGDDALRVAIDLARDGEFRERRRAYYDWQETAADRVIAGALTPGEAVTEMRELVAQYNAAVARASKTTRRRYVYTIATAVAGGALAVVSHGLVELLAGLAAAAVPVVQFLDLDRAPEPAAGRAAPAAMFSVATAALARR